ncbi:MAG TPA: PhnD/SsuA/transferrin family substrate-binding protein [Byssovorax sp.]|jgi:phosphonate transport system substrate-binding protein
MRNRRDARPRIVRLALPPRAPRRDAEGFRAAVFASSGLVLELVHMPSYAALFAAVDGGTCDAAWAPPLVALDLARCGTARPVVAFARGQIARAYHAVLLARADEPARGVGDLAGAHVGWVAPESASGYVVPRMALAALGLPASRLFGKETFFGSHARALEAITARDASDGVSLVATHGRVDRHGNIQPPDVGVPLRVLAASGPIPADVIVARTSLAACVVESLVSALVGMGVESRASLVPLAQADGFVPVADAHLDPLRTLAARAADGAFAPLAAARAPSWRPTALV